MNVRYSGSTQPQLLLLNFLTSGKLSGGSMKGQGTSKEAASTAAYVNTAAAGLRLWTSRFLCFGERFSTTEGASLQDPCVLGKLPGFRRMRA